MSLGDWLKNSWLVEHKSSAEEIAGLLAIVERDLATMAKWWGVKVANEVLYTCMRLHGHYGFAKEFPFEQRLRDCIGMESADGPREIHHGIIARELFGKEFAPF